MEQSKLSKTMLVTDLSVCCVWLLCLINSNPDGYGVLPMLCMMPLLRMWLGFLIYRRSRMALAPIVMLSLMTIGALAGHAHPAFTLYVDPWLTLLRVVPAFFGEHVITAENMSDIWFGSFDHRVLIGLMDSIWIVLVPVGIYVWRCIRKENIPQERSLRQRAGICLYVISIIFIEALVINHFYYSHVSAFILCMLLMPAPMIFNGGKIEGMLTKGEQAFVAALLLLAIAYTLGVSYSEGSIITAAVFPCVSFALFCWTMGRNIRYADAALILVASFLFIFSQYVIDMFRIIMLLMSLGLMAVPFMRFAISTSKLITTIAAYVMIAVFLPIFCIGYNPYSVLEARKIRHFDEYEYSYNGLMLVIGRDGIGIRDRYELILPAEYLDVELLMSHKPYCKVETRDGCQIYDIVKQELLSEDIFDTVVPYGEFSFLLKSDKGDKFLIMPTSYSRFNDKMVAVISEQPPTCMTSRERYHQTNDD